MRNFLFRTFPFIGRLVSKTISLEIVTTIMVLSNKPTKLTNALLFFGRAKGDDNDQIFYKAAEAFHMNLIECILINGTENEEKCGHAKTAWTKRLNNLGVTKVLSYKESSNTTEEAKNMIIVAKEKNWKSATILAQPHQVLRCMCALVKAMENANYWMKIYCLIPDTSDWFEVTRGSGNQLPMERFKHIALEYSRVLKYASIGHTATLKEVFDYMRK